MTQIYYLLLLVLVAIGSSYVTTLLPRIKTRFSSFINARRNKITRRIEQLEMRVELHTRKDGTYLDKFDDLENQIENVAEKLTKKEQRLKYRIREEVKAYLKELQK
jgi:pyridoxine 5'-phosphate synthase PdxJ